MNTQFRTPRNRRFLRAVLICVLFFSTALVVNANSSAGTYDDPVQYGRISYRGTWYQYGPPYNPSDSCAFCMWQTQTLMTSAGAEVDFTFTGDNVTWFYSRAFNRGNKCVTITKLPTNLPVQDVTNRCWSDSAPNNDVMRQVGATMWMPTYGTYRVIMTGSGSGSVLYDLDAFAVDIRTYAPGRWKADDAAVRKVPASAWTLVWNAQGGWYMRTTTPQSLLRITMDNNELFTIHYMAGPGRGKVAVFANGVNMGDIDMNNASLVRRARTYVVPLATALDATDRAMLINVTSLNSSPVEISSIDSGYIGGSYFTDSNYNPRHNLNWYFDADKTAYAAYYAATVNAMKTWSDNTNLNLSENLVSSSSADIVVTLAGYQHPFVGEAKRKVDGVSMPEPIDLFTSITSCELRLNLNASPAFNKESVILHEAGHCFSLGHRKDYNLTNYGIMYNSYTGITQLSSRDINLINQRYP